MKRIFLIYSIICIFSIMCFAQHNQNTKTLNEIKKQYPIEMYFIPAGIIDDAQAQQIQEFILSGENIGYCEIHKDEKSKIFASQDIEIEYIRKLLSDAGITNPNDYIHIIDNYILQSDDINYIPKSFPKKIDTGNPKDDERRLAGEIKQWKNAHPQEWQKILENKEKRPIK